MAEIHVFRNVRRDGGVRLGINIDGETAFHQYTGPLEEDPSLVWYLDIICTGKKLPRDPGDVKEWLLIEGPLIRKGLEALAQRMEVGWDDLTLPFHLDIQGCPKGVSIQIKGSVLRGFRATQLAGIFFNTAKHWDRDIRRLPKAEEALDYA